jgi:predicted DNA-binding transcriptional regulator AlpA
MDHPIAFENRVFSAVETAEHLRISRSMLYKLVGTKDLTPVRIGTRTLFTGREIERFLAVRAAAAEA